MARAEPSSPVDPEKAVYQPVPVQAGRVRSHRLGLEPPAIFRHGFESGDTASWR